MDLTVEDILSPEEITPTTRAAFAAAVRRYPRNRELVRNYLFALVGGSAYQSVQTTSGNLPEVASTDVQEPDCLSRTPSAVRSSSSLRSYDTWPRDAAEEAFHGLAGDIVRTIAPHSEADPVGILVQILTAFGNAIGRGPYFVAEAERHYTNLFVALVGKTSKGRKGSSWAQVKRVFTTDVDAAWVEQRVQSGLSSGEGLIWAVRDETVKMKDGEEIVSDPGVADKRLLTIESELASTLRVLAREGNTLSATIRQAWEHGRLQTLVKNSPAQATGAHISIIGHITRDELTRHLDRTEIANGLANRFLWACVRRARVLPRGGNLNEAALIPLRERLTGAINFARTVQGVQRDDDADAVWDVVYEPLSEGKPGLLGAVIGRAEAQVMRLALIFALLDRSPCIRRGHLLAALGLWDYSEASARHIFGDSLGDLVADELLRALRGSGPRGMTRTQIRDLFARNRQASEIGRALGTLVEHGLACSEVRGDTGGRPAESWIARTTFTTETTKGGDAGGVLSFQSYLELGKSVPRVGGAHAKGDAAPATENGLDLDPTGTERL